MLDGNPIGEVILKHIDVKNKGYGTQAEILSLRYAFEEMHLDIVYADVFRKNKQSQHVLTKVGFTETHRDDTFIYYQCKIAAWSMPSRPESTELQ